MIGNGIFKIMRFTDGVFKNSNALKQETYNFVSHAWLSEGKIIVGNNRAELFLVQNSEILSEFKLYEIKDSER